MTSEDEQRIHELPYLIAMATDNETVIKLASELEKLLTQRSKEKRIICRFGCSQGSS